jgi:hypothetical protein
MLGGSDQSLFEGNLSYSSVIKDLSLNPHGYWAFKITSIFIGSLDLDLCEKNCIGVADTGSSLILAPFGQNMSQIFSGLGADNKGILKCDINLFHKLPSEKIT